MTMNWAPLNDLNSRQAEAVTSTEGRIRVIAGAGTGKTKALTYRYAYLVNVLGIDPANILCLTFTNKAAAEMRQRIATMVHSGDYNDFVCTIDGFCVKFLRKEIHRLGFPKTFSILDEEDCKSLAKQAMDELGLKRTEKTVKEFLGQIAVDKALDDYITTFMLPQAKWTDNMLKSSLGNYIHRQVKEYALDFDDLENFTNYILDRFKDAREYWQNQLNYIMVDEAQDCNLDNSDKDVVLDENYRSTPKILNVANSVISYNKNRIPKDLFTRQPEGRTVIHFHAKTESEEMEWVATQIKILLDAGARLSDFAILYRSSWQSRTIEEALMKARIQYAIWGGTRFFERKEIKDCLAYLKLINDKNDDLSFERIANVPSRKLGDKFMTELKQRAKDGDASLFRALEKNTDSAALRKPGALEFLGLMNDCTQFASNSLVSDLLDRVLDKSGLKKMYREDQDEDRLENIDQLLQSVKFYESTHEAEENRLSEYLQDIALYTNQDYRKDTPTVKMMTIHQAKGLEFPFVFIIGLSEGIFPNMRTIREYKKNGEEEERRLMYVAITRAQKALFLTESEGFNVSTKMNKYPSRFLTEIKREMFVTEGFMPEDLWKGTRNMMHVLDEETYNPGEGDDFASERTEYDSPFEVGDVVVHNIFGEGTVVGVNKENTTFEVRFKDGDTRHLRADFLRLQDLPE